MRKGRIALLLRDTATVQHLDQAANSPGSGTGSHFGHPIGKDDPRRPASAGFKIDQVAPVGCIPQAELVALLSSTSFAGKLAE
jgi:hypothetical protein